MKFQENKHLLHFEQMDIYHKEFIDIYNSVAENTKSYKDVMLKIFEQTKLHFKSEEDLMDKYNYPRKKEHTDEHDKVLNEMDFFISKADTKLGEKILTSYYKERLPDWFENHLISMDIDLSSFIKNIEKKDNIFI